MTSAVLIVPADHLDEANQFGEDLGYGPKNYSIPLSADGLQPATHWGCRAEVTQSFIDMVENPPPEAQPIIDVLIYDFQEKDGYTHFMEIIAANNLIKIEPAEA